MSYIVTGSAGFIGSHLSEKLVKEGKEVVGLDNFHNYYSKDIKRNNIKKVEKTADKASGSFNFIEGSILNDKDIEKLPEEPEKVFHLAAIAGVRYSIDHPNEYTEINTLGTSKLLSSLDPDKLVFASSSSVYGEVPEEELPVREDRDLNPKAPYPMSKIHAEELVRLHSQLYELDYTIVRPFTVYGPRQRPDEAFTKFIKMVLDGEPVTIYGDGEQSRDFTFVQDIVRGMMMAMEKGDGTYNLGSGRRITVNQMVETLDKVMDEEVEKKYVEQPEGDVSHTHADISKREKEIEYSPEVEFEEGARKCVEWVKEMREKNLL